MTALAANRPVPNVLKSYASGIGYVIDYPVGALEEIDQGEFVTLDAGDQFLAEWATAEQFVGVSLDRVTGGASNGDNTCRVLVEGVIQHAITSVAVADIGKAVTADSATTLSLTNDGTDPVCGVVVGVPATGTAIVKLFKPRTPHIIWAVTNFVSDLTLAHDGANTVYGDAIGTLVTELIAQGYFSGAVAA